MQYKRLMGIDYGDVRIGIAFSDLMQVIASPYEVYKRVDLQKDIQHICDLIKSQDVETVVFGLPLNMDGTEGIRAELTREFASHIAQQLNVNIVFQDERLSSVEAEEILLSANVRRENRKQLIDKLSASIILESYMNGRR